MTEKNKQVVQFIKENTTSVTLRFNRNNAEDMELLEFLKSQGNMTKYLKSLIKYRILKRELDSLLIGELPGQNDYEYFQDYLKSLEESIERNREQA